jgi:putative PIN family toxin of toxin-antitoxin system
MTPKNPSVFLDTSVIISAVLSPTGDARKLFLLGESGIITLVIGPTVLKECDEVVRRKVPRSLPLLAQLLMATSIGAYVVPTKKLIEKVQALVRYAPDAHVLAEAIHTKPDWFVTHDKEHFLKSRSKFNVPFEIGTPGDFLQKLKEHFSTL